MTYTIKQLLRLGSKYIRLGKDEDCPELSNCPNAGPNCNVKGMRNLYWGKNAVLVKKGQYVYYIGELK